MTLESERENGYPIRLLGLDGNYVPLIDRGPVIYSEEWATKQRNKDASDATLSIIGITAAFIIAAFLSYGFLRLGVDNILTMVLFIFGAPLITYMVFRSYKFYIRTRSLGPFQMCENGLVVPMKPNGLRILRRAFFVPWANIDKVKLLSEDLFGMTLRKVILFEKTGFTINFRDYGIEDVMGALKIVARKVPAKLDPVFDFYLGPKEKRRVVAVPETGQKVSRLWDPRESVGLLLIFLFLVNGMGIVMAFDFNEPIAFMIVMIITFLVSFLWVRSWINGIVEEEVHMLKNEATALKQGIRIPTFWLNRLTRYVREIIPYSEISSLATKLDIFMYHEGAFRLSDGHEYRIKYNVYEEAVRYSGFNEKEDGLEFTNPRPRPLLAPIGKWKVSGLLFIVILIGLVLPMTVIAIVVLAVMATKISWDDLDLYLHLLMVIIMVPFAAYGLYFLRKLKKHAKEQEGVLVTGEGIYAPGAPSELQFVQRSDISSFEMAKGEFGLNIRVETTKGPLVIPLSTIDDLAKFGYHVKGAEEMGIKPLVEEKDASDMTDDQPAKMKDDNET